MAQKLQRNDSRKKFKFKVSAVALMIQKILLISSGVTGAGARAG